MCKQFKFIFQKQNPSCSHVDENFDGNDMILAYRICVCTYVCSSSSCCCCICMNMSFVSMSLCMVRICFSMHWTLQMEFSFEVVLPVSSFLFFFYFLVQVGEYKCILYLFLFFKDFILLQPLLWYLVLYVVTFT